MVKQLTRRQIEDLRNGFVTGEPPLGEDSPSEGWHVPDNGVSRILRPPRLGAQRRANPLRGIDLAGCQDALLREAWTLAKAEDPALTHAEFKALCGESSDIVQATSENILGTLMAEHAEKDTTLIQKLKDLGVIEPGGYNPSPYQLSVCDWLLHGTGNAVVEAVAGSGKTTTLLQAARITSTFGGRQVFVAFNKSIVLELREKLGKVQLPMEAMTMNSLGNMSLWKYPRSEGKNFLGKNKPQRLAEVISYGLFPFDPYALKTERNKLRNNKASWSLQDKERYNEIAKLLEPVIHVERAMASIMDLMASTLCPTKSIDDILELNDTYKKTDSRTIEIIAPHMHSMFDLCLHWLGQGKRGFIDQTYWPATDVIPELRYQYDTMFIDESQDFNPCNIEVVRKSLKPSPRFVAVGDRFQSIYAFRGADSEAIPNIIRDFNCVVLPLSITYRCPTKVVDLAKAYVPQIEAREGAPEGEVTTLAVKNFREWLEGDNKPRFGDMILCRTNAPLAEVSSALWGAGINATLMGAEGLSAEIGNVIEDVSNRADFRWLDFLDGLMQWHDTKADAIARAEGESNAEDLLNKLAEVTSVTRSLYGAFLKKPKGDGSLAAFKNWIFETFKDQELSQEQLKKALKVCTIHKAKGLEADRVFWIGRSAYSPLCKPKVLERMTEREVQQERNLEYVAITRAVKELILIELPLENKTVT